MNRRLTRRVRGFEVCHLGPEASHVEKAVEEEVTAGAFEEIKEKLEELLGQLNLEERHRTLGQASTFTPLSSW